MTTLEQRYMETVPPAIRKIAANLEASRPRLVKIEDIYHQDILVNPREVAYVRKNGSEGVIISLTNGHVFKNTIYETAADAAKALGLGD